MPRSQCENENVQFVQELAEVDGPFESPININYRDLTKLELPSLSWNRIDSWPKKMKITNTGHTVIISGKWKSERPYLTGGPLTGKYVFSQIHFHWGQDESKGSEHQICGEGFPLEMHVAHFKTDYLSQENALKEKDGMVVLVYLFKLQDEPNDAFKKILNLLPNVKQPCTSQAFEPKPILTLVNPFKDDYFMYWGSVITPTCAHILLWLICREPFGISREQVDEFRKIMDSSQRPIYKNNRDVQPVHKRNVFHVNAMRDLDSPLLPIKQMLECYCKGGPDEDTTKMGQPDAPPPPPPLPPPSQNAQNECNCAVYYRNQEEIEGGNKTKIMCSSIKGNRKPNSSPPRSAYLKQYVYVVNAVTTPAPFLAKKYESEMIKKVHYSVGKQTKSEDTFRTNRVTQSCCFYPMEKINQIKPRSDRRKNREKKKSNSFRAFSNILNSLEALKNHTFKKLKEIEAINQEIKGMKSFCDTAEDKRWLRKIEKVMTSQKHFTIKKSQNCFGELKKLAKECTLDKLFDGRQFPTGRNYQEMIPIKNSENDQTNQALICHENYARKEDGVDHSINQDLKYSIKAQKLIQSFFEDIKDTEDLQKTVRKNLEFKKIESTHNKEAGDSNQVNSKGYITEKMFIMGNLGDRFFTEVTTEVETEEEKVEEVIITVEESMGNQESERIDNKKDGKSMNNKRDLIIPLHKTTELPKLNDSLDEFENYFSITDNQFPNLINMSDTETTSDRENLIKVFGEKKINKKNAVRKQLENYLKKLNDLTEEKFRKELITDDTLASMWYSNSNFLTDSTETQRMFIAKFRNKRSRRDLWKRKSSVIAKLSSKRIFDKSHRKSKLKNFSIEGYYLKKKKHSKNTNGESSCDMSSTSRETAVIVNKSKWKRLVKAQLKLGLENSCKDSSGSEMECKIISPKRKRLKLDNKKKNATENTPPKKSKEILKNEPVTKAVDHQEVIQTKNDRGEQVVLPADNPERYREAITQTALSNIEIRPSDGNFKTKSVKTIAAETTCDLRKSKTLNSCSREIKILVESRKIPSKILVKNKSLTCLTKPSRFFSPETTQRLFVENLDSRRKSLRDSFDLKKPIVSPRVNESVGKSDETSTEVFQVENSGLERATKGKEPIPEAEYKVYFFKNLQRQVEKELVSSNQIKREKSKIPLVKQWKRKEVNGSKTKPIEEKSEIQKESLKTDYVKNIKKDEWQTSTYFSKNYVSRSLSGESLNSLSRPIKRKNKKRPLISKRNSKQFPRRNSLIIRKPNKVDSRPLYRAGLPHEEQLKQEVERYIIQNFGGYEAKPEEEKNKVKEVEKVMITDLKVTEENPKETLVKEASTVTEEAKQDARQFVKRPRQGIPRLKKEIKPKVPPSVTPKGNHPAQKPVHDFVKLNKLMAGKFRRGTPPSQKQNEVKTGTKRVVQKKEKINSNEQKNTPLAQPVSKPAEKGANNLKASQKCEKTQESEGKGQKPENVKCFPSGMEVQKMAPPKTRLLPAYMMTSYLPPPMEIVHNQKKEMNRYLMNPDMKNYSTDGLKENLKQEKLSDFVYKKDLEYLLRLQSCIHGELSTGVENPMSYVKTLLGQEYCGPTVLADTSNEPFDYCKPLHYSDSRNSGLVLIEMSDFLESSTSNSDLSGYFKLKPIESLSQQLKNKIYMKKVPQESGDPGIVNPIMNHNVQEDWRGDSNYDCQIFITLSANETECGTSLSATEENSTRTQELTNQSSTYSEISSSQSITMKQHRKKRKDNEISVEMKRKLLEILETEIKREMGVEWSGPGDAPSEGQAFKLEDGEGNQRSQSFDNMEVLAEISETMRQYLSGFKEGKLPRSTGGGE